MRLSPLRITAAAIGCDGYIWGSASRFGARVWKAILEQCYIEYRKPYAVHHSAISHALANGAKPMDLVEQTEHDKRVLLDVYAPAIQQKSLFLEF